MINYSFDIIYFYKSEKKGGGASNYYFLIQFYTLIIYHENLKLLFKGEGRKNKI